MQRGRHGDPLVDVSVGDLQRGRRGVRLAAREQLEQDDAHGVHVGAGVGGRPGDVLGGEVGGRAHDGLPGHGVGRGGAGQAEVRDRHPAVVADEHVLGLHVPVHQPGAVRGGQAVDERTQEPQRLPGRERCTVPDDGAQRAAGHVLHHEVGQHVAVLGLGVALVQDRDDVRMGQPRRRLGLLLEPADEDGVLRQVRVHDLERHLAVETLVHGQVDGGHAAPGQPLDDPVAAVDDAPHEGVPACAAHRPRVGQAADPLGAARRRRIRTSPSRRAPWPRSPVPPGSGRCPAPRRGPGSRPRCPHRGWGCGPART